MKFSVVFALFATAVMAGPVVERDNDIMPRDRTDDIMPRVALAEPETAYVNDIEKRACVKTSCSCAGVPNGLFCGDGALNCKKGNVYQCGGNGKLSCSYGVRNSCKKCNKLSC